TPWSHDFVFWFMFVGITVSIVIAVRNLRNGIADRDAALKGAAIIVTLNMVTWLLLADHQFNAHEYVYLISGLETALACALEQWILYVALEPIIRRRFPQVLSSWKRLLAGRMWDPLVGRDVLAGVVTGIALRSAEAISYLSDVTGSIPTQSLQQTLTIRETLACISYGTYSAMYMSLVLFVLAKLSSRVLRHPIAGYLVMGAFLFMLTWSIISPKYQHSPALGIALFATAFVASIVCLRLGLLTTVAMALTWIFATITPVTMKVDSFYFESGLVGVAGILGLASYATYVSQLGYRR
ncbi:MAG: hypothetical protein KDA87_24340, partial [Planctomycetales bacterium]|nr:hypothetical protein [Planctomycetales bacterium]